MEEIIYEDEKLMIYDATGADRDLLLDIAKGQHKGKCIDRAFIALAPVVYLIEFIIFIVIMKAGSLEEYKNIFFTVNNVLWIVGIIGLLYVFIAEDNKPKN